MPDISLLQDLAVIMIVAGAVTVAFHLIRQPVVLGYILAGLIIGPYTLGGSFIRDRHSIELLSQLGLIFLMFSLGLRFSLRKLSQVGLTAFIAAPLEIVLMFAAGYEVGRFFGFTPITSLFLGAIVSISSSTIITKVLEDLGKAKESFAQIIFGILIVEDILAIAMIALLSGITAGGGHQPFSEILGKMGTLGVFLASVVVVGLILVPRLLRYVAAFKSNEMLLVAVLGLCFGVSLLALSLGFSVALGAFLIGAIVAESRERGRIEALIEPVRDTFSAVFFVAVGMLIDPAAVWANAGTVAVLAGVVVVGKIVTCSLGASAGGRDLRTSLRVGMGMAQIGEFSFIIAALGQETGRTGEFPLRSIAVSVSAITTLATPYLIRNSDVLARGIEKLTPRPLAVALELYGRWVSRLTQSRPEKNQIRSLMRKWALQIAINMTLVTGIFIAAAALAARTLIPPAWLPGMLRWAGGLSASLWLAAAVLSIPLIIATVRKLRAIAMVLSEMSVSRSAAGENTPAARALLANAILFAASLLLGLWIMVLSAAILPPWPVLIVQLLVIGLVTTLLWRYFIRIYAKAQIALRETLSSPLPLLQPEADQPFAAILSDVELARLTIEKPWPSAGKLIRELQLRTKTGASAVAIERDGKENVINPGPDEELAVGDRVLLLGTRSQLEAARRLLRGQ